MAKEVKRKKGEPFERFYWRCKSQARDSGLFSELKSRQEFTKKKSKNVRKTNTVKKIQKKSKEEYLIRTGKMPEPNNRFRRRRR